MAELTIEAELAQATKLKQGKRQSRQDYLKGLVLAANGDPSGEKEVECLAEDDWELLSDSAQKWVVAGANAVSKNEDVADFPDSVVEAEDEDEETETVSDTSVSEDEEDEDVDAQVELAEAPPVKKRKAAQFNGPGVARGAVPKKTKPVKVAPAKKAEKVVAKKQTSKANGKSKVAKIGAMLLKGCTSKQITDSMGWPTVSVPAMAKANGLKLTKEKVKGKPTFYRAKAI